MLRRDCDNSSDSFLLVSLSLDNKGIGLDIGKRIVAEHASTSTQT